MNNIIKNNIMENKYGFVVNKKINKKIDQLPCPEAQQAIIKLAEPKKWALTGIYFVELPELDEYGSKESDLSLLQYYYYRLIYNVAKNIMTILESYSKPETYKQDMQKLVDKFLSLCSVPKNSFRHVSKKNVMLLCKFIADTKFNEYCKYNNEVKTNWSDLEKVADTILANNGGTKDLLETVIKDYNNYISDDEQSIKNLISKGKQSIEDLISKKEIDYYELKYRDEISIEAFCNVSDHNVLAVNFPYNFLSNNKFPDVSALIYIERIDATYRAYLNVCRCLPFVWDVIGSLINKTLPLICEAKRDYILNLLYTIPIYLREKQPKTWNKEESNVDIVDLLGAYFSNTKEKSPYIEIYVDTILNYASGKKFKWLFTKVLIHELAHAALDINNSEYLSSVTPKVLYNTDFGRWREESMANAVALRVIRDYGDLRFYDYSEFFMLHQPAEYALGVEMVDWDYTDFCSVIDGKRYGVGDILQQEWLDYAQGNPTWEGLHRWNGRLSK